MHKHFRKIYIRCYALLCFILAVWFCGHLVLTALIPLQKQPPSLAPLPVLTAAATQKIIDALTKDSLTLSGQHALAAAAQAHRHIIRLTPTNTTSWIWLAHLQRAQQAPTAQLVSLWENASRSHLANQQNKAWFVDFGLELYPHLTTTQKQILQQHLRDYWLESDWQTVQLLAKHQRLALMETLDLSLIEQEEFKKSYTHFRSGMETHPLPAVVPSF